MKKISKFWRIQGMFFLFLILMNILGSFSVFSDWWADSIYPTIASVLARCTVKIPFLFCEILAYTGIFLLLLGVILLVLFLFLRKNKKFCKSMAIYGKTLLCIIQTVLLLYTLLYFIPIRSTPLKAPNGVEKTDYTLTDLQNLAKYIVQQGNALAEQIPRDEEGHMIYEEEEIQKACKTAIANLDSDYSRLGGFVTNPKNCIASIYLKMMGIGGFTVPFTMEICCNSYCSKMVRPVLYAHEMAHHKGYYLERDAEFLGYIACIKSDNLILQYTAYFDMYDWVSDALNKQMGKEAYKTYVKENNLKFSDAYWEDWSYYQQEIQKAYDAVYTKSEIAQSVENEVETIADNGWQAQEKILKEYNYSGVLLLLLQYYDGVVI